VDAGGLAEVKRVYLLPMQFGMDQYLANRLTREGVFQVVADPASADAIFTDQLGAAFEARMKALYPPPPVAKPAKPEKKDVATTAKNEPEPSDAPDEKVAQSAESMRIVPSSRGRGMVFLVKRGTGEVLWSDHREPTAHHGPEMDKAAAKLVKSLKRALNPASVATPGGK
jgi:hypothetical protein